MNPKLSAITRMNIVEVKTRRTNIGYNENEHYTGKKWIFVMAKMNPIYIEKNDY